MPSKTGSKKRRQDQDQQIDARESKWAKMIEQVNYEQEADATEIYAGKQKIAFSFDFSNEHVLNKGKKAKPKKEEVIDADLMAQIEKRKKQDKAERQKKDKIKQQKQQERKKIMEIQKEQDKTEKEEFKKIAQQVERMKELQKLKSSNKCLPIILLLLVFLMLFLQYNQQIYVRLQRFKLDGQSDYYADLECDSGITNEELRKKYKNLIFKYHPDKNPKCPSCKEKFELIMKAYEVLGDPEKRKHYDESSGFVSKIKSESITLTPDNYGLLVNGSPSLWIVQVYDSTSQYCHYFAQFWEQIVRQQAPYVSFGRVDVWTQSNMLSYLPYSFKIFPSFYYVHKGNSDLCQIDYRQPIQSLKKCIEERYLNYKIAKISSLKSIESQKFKIDIVLPKEIKLSSRLKIINTKYQEHFNFYQLQDSGKKVRALHQGTQIKSYIWSHNSAETAKTYESFLESQFVQKMSICKLAFWPEDKPFVLHLNGSLQIPPTNKYPVIKLEQQTILSTLIDQFKQKYDLYENYQIGLYRNGLIDLGYFSDIQLLNGEQGDPLDLPCVKTSIFNFLINYFQQFFFD